MTSYPIKPVRNWDERTEKLGDIVDMTVVKIGKAYNVILLQKPESIQKIVYLYDSKGKSKMIMQKISYQASACTRLSDSRVAFACNGHIVFMRPHPARLVTWATSNTDKNYSALCSIDRNTMWALRINEEERIFVDRIDVDSKVLKTVDCDLVYNVMNSFLSYCPSNDGLVISTVSENEPSKLMHVERNTVRTRRTPEAERYNCEVSSLTINDKGRIVFVERANCQIRYMSSVKSNSRTLLSSDDCPDLTSPWLVHIYEDKLFCLNKTGDSGDLFMFHCKELKYLGQ